MLPLFFLFGLLALGPQVVLSASQFKFTIGTVQQCEPVSITFSGVDKAHPVPASLILLPFNATPIAIPIPNAATNSSGVYVTFLPLAANTQFMASLDDETGDNSAKVSDVIRVLPSPTNNASCLSTATVTTPAFTLVDTPSQCENFTVAYATTRKAPTIRAFNPKGGSNPLTMVSDDTDTGRASYIMNQFRGFQVVLMMFDDADSLDQGVTTPLLTVGGDSSSSKSCFGKIGNGSSGSSSTSGADSTSGIPRGVVIGLSVAGSLVLLTSILMALYLIRRRRQKRRIDNIAFDPALLEKQQQPYDSKEDYGSPPPPFSGGSGVNYSAGFVRNPAYTAESFSPSHSNFGRDSYASWVVPPSTAPPANRRQASQGGNSFGPAKTESRLSINPYDIETMLDLAANRRSSEQRSPMSSPPRDPAPITQVNLRKMPSRGHLRDPSDIPAAPSSMALSNYSYTPNNPFTGEDNTVIVDSPESMRTTHLRAASIAESDLSYADSADFEIVRRPPVAALPPPSSLRVMVKPSSRFSDPSLMDNGGIGSFPAPPRPHRDSTESWGNVRSPGGPRVMR